MRSGAGVFCPRSRAFERTLDFFDERCEVLPVVEDALLEVSPVFRAAARHTPFPAAASSTSPTPMTLLRRILSLSTPKPGSGLIVCFRTVPHLTETPSKCARCRRAGEP